ncbi:MAG TPA: hypothetical protein PLB62_00110 [Candidatus Sumerlaeota bacterium]|nr:hypothetical protein [Candidatus Sumerlaeota bacterium]
MTEFCIVKDTQLCDAAVRNLWHKAKFSMKQSEFHSPMQPDVPHAEIQSHCGMPWTKEEDSKLVTGFDNGITIPEMARMLKRTELAIRMRLERLGKITPSQPQ